MNPWLHAIECDTYISCFPKFMFISPKYLERMIVQLNRIVCPLRAPLLGWRL